MSKKNKEQIEAETSELEKLRQSFEYLDKLEASFTSEDGTVIQDYINNQLKDTQEKYINIDRKDKNAMLDFSLLQGAELGLLQVMHYFANVKKEKKMLAEKIEKLLSLQQREKDHVNKNRIISQNINKEDDNDRG